ncbi:type II toxin-antitoxin system prevent-host-death family antitoxin [Streptomyces sp. H27-H1]|uniref:type II toxin-antitoxin system Phd/YefM family antitoxin n=1 Tax=Streptomyces sp. H27-H1 TaxID=2996461 RepID=UPI0022712903|nr:type II toxin-antitoxin system prevent-host-death family antitoxin [Streptomyces sp. H27-H1]MCY0932335.1 type II toxin-antitoxin system prevent-host-death family antitoxin [Streptomyces sp. H27-H1]
MNEHGIREARAQLAGLVTAAARGDGTLITKHGRPVAALLPPGAAELWERHQLLAAEGARRQSAADDRRSRREEWESEAMHPVAAVIRYQGHPGSDDPLCLPDADQVPRPRRELRGLVEHLRPDYRWWMREAWDDSRRPEQPYASGSALVVEHDQAAWSTTAPPTG